MRSDILPTSFVVSLAVDAIAGYYYLFINGVEVFLIFIIDSSLRKMSLSMIKEGLELLDHDMGKFQDNLITG